MCFRKHLCTGDTQVFWLAFTMRGKKSLLQEVPNDKRVYMPARGCMGVAQIDKETKRNDLYFPLLIHKCFLSPITVKIKLLG